MHSLELASRSLEVAGSLGAARKDDSVEVLHDLSRIDSPGGVAVYALRELAFLADEGIEDEGYALLLHLLSPSVDERLGELEVRDAEPHQAADPVILLEDGNVMACSRELLRAGEPRGAGADYRNLLAGLNR